MKLRNWSLAALAACLLSIGAVRAHAFEAPDLADAGSEASETASGDSGGEYAPVESLGPGMAEEEYSETPTRQSQGAYYSDDPTSSYDVLEDNVAAIGSDMGTAASGLMSRPMQLFVGAEYIYAQATFSDALAFVEQRGGEGDVFQQLDYDYGSSFNVYGGFYWCDCAGSVIFDFTRLESRSNDIEVTDDSNITFPFEVQDPGAGGLFRVSGDVRLDSYSIGFAKAIPLGCLDTGRCCGDACCDGCPAWDIGWYGGVRYADVGWQQGASAFNAAGAFDNSAITTLDFDGFGGQIGLSGRRYIGRRGLFSVYGRGDLSVLFGESEVNVINADELNSVFTRKTNDATVPVTEVELGGTASLAPHASLSVGWFWSAWHDLGNSPTYDFEVPDPAGGAVNQFEVSSFDDANILGWTGFFARAEIAF